MIRYYGITEAARALGLTRQRVKQLYDAGKLPVPDAVVGTRQLWESTTFIRWAIARQLAVNAAPRGHAPNITLRKEQLP